MSGGVTRGENQRPEFKFVAILHAFALETVLRGAFAARVNFCRAGARCQFARTAHQIGMNMGFEYVRDRDAIFSGQLEINFDVRPRIDHRRRGLLVVADQIRNRGNSIRYDSLKNKRHRFSRVEF